jgi:hypothetical protein
MNDPYIAALIIVERNIQLVNLCYGTNTVSIENKSDLLVNYYLGHRIIELNIAKAHCFIILLLYLIFPLSNSLSIPRSSFPLNINYSYFLGGGLEKNTML